MTTLSINRKPKGLYSKAEPKQPAPALAKAISSGSGKVAARVAATGSKKSAASKRNHRRLEKLAGLFPDVISLSDPIPMKVGILNDMSQSLKERGEISGESQIKNALTRYTRNRRYQSALAAGGGGNGVSMEANFYITTTGGIDEATQKQIAQMMETVAMRVADRECSRGGGILQRRQKK